MHLHRNARGPRGPELRDRETAGHEQGAAGAGPGLGELLGGHHPEREAGVDDVGADRLSRGHPALCERSEARFAREGHAVLDRVERAPVEQVGRVHRVPRLPELVGERPHPVGQPLNVVVQDNLGHLRSSSAIDPTKWNVPGC